MNRIKFEYEKEYNAILKWVKNDVYREKKIISDDNLLESMHSYLKEEKNNDKLERKIINAAQTYTTIREFEIIKISNSAHDGLQTIEKNLYNELSKYKDLPSITRLLLEPKIKEALSLVEQLRYQSRWSQTPRVPMTSVLGHSMYVALLIYFLSKEIGACPKRIVNNFFAAIFHDLPESVTRDIIFPVKKATKEMPDIIKSIEQKICDDELFPRLPKKVSDAIKYLIGYNQNDEFSNRIIKNYKIENIEDVNKIDDYNKDEFSPVDGKLVKICDDIAAFMVAYISEYYGIKSNYLHDAIKRIKTDYENNAHRQYLGLDVGELFKSFGMNN